MTREEAIRYLSVHSSTNGSGLCTDEQHYEAKQMAIKALEQEFCDNAVSRKAVLDIVESYSESQSNVEDVTHDIISGIMALPPVTP